MDENLRLPTVLAATGRKKSSHYADIKAGLFVPPVKIGPRAAAYAPSFLPDGIASALGWVACGLVVFCFIYVLIPAARRTGKRR